MTRLTFSRRAALSTPVLSTQTVGRTSIRCRASAPRAHRPPHLARNFVMSGDEALIAKTQQLALHDQPPERFARRRDELRAHRCIDVSGRLRLVSLECLQRTGELAPRGAERSRRLLHELHVERFGESDRHVNFSESPAPLLVVRMPPARVPCAHTCLVHSYVSASASFVASSNPLSARCEFALADRARRFDDAHRPRLQDRVAFL